MEFDRSKKGTSETMKLHALPTIYTDYETFWSSDYTLSKMPTQAYILDERFKAHGCCIAVNDGPIKWFTHEQLPAVLPAVHAKYPKAIWVNQNSLFDATIHALHYGVHPLFLADTAAMSRALVGPHLKKHSLDDISKLLLQQEKGKALVKSLGVWDLKAAGIEEEIAEYCKLDVHLMREIYKILCPLFPAAELEVMTWVTRMMTEPKILLDQDLLWQYHHEVVDRKTKILEELQVDKKDIMSNDKFATLLLALGVEPPRKTSLRTGKEAYAFAKTDAGLKDLLEHESEDVQALVAARLEVKSTIEETRSKTFAGLAAFNPISVPLAYSGAVNTHRFSGRDKLNFQNLKRGGKLRDSILPPEGYSFIVSDLSQIELRLGLWLAGHSDQVRFLADGGDSYSELATEIYGVEVTKKKAQEDAQIAEMRHVGKGTKLGFLFGMGGNKHHSFLTSMGINVTLEFSKMAIKTARVMSPGVPALWRKMELLFLKLLTQEPFDYALNGVQLHFGDEPLFGAPGIRLPNGLWLKYPSLKIEDEQWSYMNAGEEIKIFGGYMLENLCQALARIVVTEKSVKINRHIPVVLSVHDEAVALAPEEDAEEWSEWMHGVMIEDVWWLAGLPLDAETKFGKRYGEIK